MCYLFFFLVPLRLPQNHPDEGRGAARAFAQHHKILRGEILTFPTKINLIHFLFFFAVEEGETGPWETRTWPVLRDPRDAGVGEVGLGRGGCQGSGHHAQCEKTDKYCNS